MVTRNATASVSLTFLLVDPLDVTARPSVSAVVGRRVDPVVRVDG